MVFVEIILLKEDFIRFHVTSGNFDQSSSASRK
jgi:hypothetical protein